ncbi:MULTISPECIES: helix-turn-helix domain-containing protein [Listeria]|uniref:helix-turn-helix domain-containing protein n=1 Tax=Listeria TaxID=1637 RepID=UPI000BDE5B60|nr:MULTISPECIES: helix-turn-helix transcriptional regulator [Listeria]EAA0329162.1 XRE family transcriptional regulator [Listeria monocytogenes]EAC2933437.1 XRE family transcriptional regulator [Listeria monocytogenes]EAC4093175.1 XRE family transcriptional regulator [Listeria monocytogenes]EAC5079617.1 XRE family transcriptional regulator [Listeria monocytogenes]EAC5914116.1 XRE family transcriptional regulator [Listeria monocytogenes]
MKQIMLSPNDILRKYRQEKGISLLRMSESLGYNTLQAYANVEYGRTKLSFDVACKAADVLGIEVKDLLRENHKRKV